MSTRVCFINFTNIENYDINGWKFFGNVFKLTTFGESHGVAIGGVIDGCPAGISIDFDAIQHEMDRRKQGNPKL